MSEPILIAGLPGCGKSRWIAAREAEGAPFRWIEWQPGQSLDTGCPVWTLVDLRGEPTDTVMEALQPLLAASCATIGVFAEETDVFRQSRWREKIRACKNGGDPVHFSHYMQAPFLDELPRCEPEGAPVLSWPTLHPFRVQMEQVMLEHLLFVLQGLEASTAMRFWRVRGVLDTLEYANPVAVEGSLAGLWTHAGERVDGQLHLLVENPDLSALEEGLRAALAPGRDMDISLIPD